MQTPVRELLVDQLVSKAGVTYTVTSPGDRKLLYTVETSEYGEPQVIVTRHTDVAHGHTQGQPAATTDPPPPPPPPSYNEPPPPYDPPPYNSIDRIPNPTRRHSFQPTDYLVGTASFQPFTPNIDIYLTKTDHGNDTSHTHNTNSDGTTHIPMTRPNPLSMKRRFPTHSLLGRLAWKEEKFGLSGHLKLVDEQKRVVARYVNRWSRVPVHDSDQLLFYLPDRRLEQNLDLVVLSGLASVEYRRQADLEWNANRTGTGTILPMALMGTGFGFII